MKRVGIHPQVDSNMPRVRVQAFRLGTALFVKVKHLRLREAVTLASPLGLPWYIVSPLWG